jgi:alkanesulfonate monooxygenase SsuD/methylene tetrahydromethanopterin reductase-like flavin-dependent oxidoreductase (luciferase family)
LGGNDCKYGLLLPHFGGHASREKLLKGAVQAEKYGFDSVWVRDHLVYHPHGMEDQSRTHVEPIVVLSAIASVTDRLILGTGSLIPYRHPIHTALCLSSLEFMAGPGRVIAGWGSGAFDHEFDAIGMGGQKRGDVMREQFEVMRKLWSGESVSFKGQFYTFDDVDIHPSPSAPIPIWYCGDSVFSVKKAVEHAQGWMPGRITVKTFAKRVKRMTQLSEEAGRPRPTPSAIPIVSPGKTKEAGLARVNWKGILEDAKKSTWELPDSGAWATSEDLDGAVIAGTAADFADVVSRYHDAGMEHLVFDLRFRFEDWYDGLAMLGEEVLPLVKGGNAASPKAAKLAPERV